MEERKDVLLLRAAGVFLRLGLKSVTMDTLANELGVSKKTLYKHFEDKNELVNAIIEQRLEMDKQVCAQDFEIAENAIDALLRISRTIMENIGSINPTVFFDLKKNYPQAYQKIVNHKKEFVYNTYKSNIERGITEGLFRENMDPDVIAKMHVAMTDVIMGGEVFPWPDYEFRTVFLEVFRFQIRGMASEEGIAYLKERINREINE